MGGYGVAPQALGQVSGRLHGASQQIEQGAGAPPVPQAGALTGLLGSYLAQVCEAMGNVSAGAAALGQAVADNRDVYTSREYDAAAAFEAQHQK